MANLINYVKKIWKNAPDTTTPISAANLNNMEDGIDACADAINESLVRYMDVKNNLTSTDTDKPLSAAQGKELQDKKLPKAGGTMTGRLTLDNGTNDTPEVYFNTKDYGYAYFDKYQSNIRLLGSDGMKIFFSNDSIRIGDNSYNIKKFRNVQYNVAWKNCPNGASGSYLYEDTNGISTYDLPATYCVVDVFKANSTRGVAIAYQWNQDGRGVWINRLHDTWKGWKPINGAVQKRTTIGNYSNGSLALYYQSNGNVVTCTGKYNTGTTVSSELNTAMFSIPLAPKNFVPFVMSVGAGTTQYKAVVDASGNVFARQALSASTNYEFSFSYIYSD